MVAYYRGRPARIEVVLILLSFETFVVMGLILLYLVSPLPVYSSLAHTVFSTWIAALLTVLPSYIIFAGVSQMAANKSLVAVILAVALEFGFLTFVAGAMMVYNGTYTLATFFDFLVSVAKSQVSVGTVPALSALSLLVPSVAVFCSLLVYATISSPTAPVQPKVTFLLPLASALASLAWVYAAVVLVPNSLLSFTVPGIIVVALVWIYARG